MLRQRVSVADDSPHERGLRVDEASPIAHASRGNALGSHLGRSSVAVHGGGTRSTRGCASTRSTTSACDSVRRTTNRSLSPQEGHSKGC